eukprot:CAMPEP_0185759496 /NCGR_PEP_ID=MMETSP1174-20130828/18238_1 /TAXON_ID=35687 /ORGANISM="Dictyocha speculum, Strain CCMP1381" /LENGTH=77 /DNA_ID=CAMNT_0028439857 /DNA_START=77 /DNA_END=307 /DNA_ORIENTATION=-
MGYHPDGTTSLIGSSMYARAPAESYFVPVTSITESWPPSFSEAYAQVSSASISQNVFASMGNNSSGPSLRAAGMHSL